MASIPRASATQYTSRRWIKKLRLWVQASRRFQHPALVCVAPAGPRPVLRRAGASTRVGGSTGNSTRARVKTRARARARAGARDWARAKARAKASDEVRAWARRSRTWAGAFARATAWARVTLGIGLELRLGLWLEQQLRRCRNGMLGAGSWASHLPLDWGDWGWKWPWVPHQPPSPCPGGVI